MTTWAGSSGGEMIALIAVGLHCRFAKQATAASRELERRDQPSLLVLAHRRPRGVAIRRGQIVADHSAAAPNECQTHEPYVRRLGNVTPSILAPGTIVSCQSLPIFSSSERTSFARTISELSWKFLEDGQRRRARDKKDVGCARRQPGECNLHRRETEPPSDGR